MTEAQAQEINTFNTHMTVFSCNQLVASRVSLVNFQKLVLNYLIIIKLLL